KAINSTYNKCTALCCICVKLVEGLDQHVPVSTWIPTLPSSSSSSSSSSILSLLLSSSSPLVIQAPSLYPPFPPHSSSSPSSSLSSSQSSPGSSPAGFPASTVITVSVILLLLLIGITFLTLILQKRRKINAGGASSDQSPVQNSGNDQEIPLSACEYEEIKDTKELSPSDAESSAVYSNVRLPIIPCDSTVNSNAQLPTIPSDQDVYSTAQLPTIPSDQDVYSTAQVPTGQSAEKPAEGLTYAAVSFHSNTTSSNDAVPQVREDVTSDYASVSHVTSSV
ncbi:putative protein TPRXL, partial [Clarias gariepinus]|uniref:putative protein TPRXL n=1 Tax=Clarias gariepinus TaxID=13013 RepID=UPI00234DBF33